MKHLKQFETEGAYTQFKDTENYVLPNVSYVKDTKDVKYERKKAYMLRAKYEATPDNLVAFTGASNIKSLNVNGTPIKIEPINNETTTFDVLGENISMDLETREATFPESYLIKSPVSSWSFKAKDPNYVINENTYICLLSMFDGVTMADPISFENAINNNMFTTSDGITLEANDRFLDAINTGVQNGELIGLTLVDIDWDNGTFAFTDTEHQTIVTTGGMPNYSFDSEGTYDVKIELVDPTLRIKFAETTLTSIEIGNDITSINDDAFKGCTNLTSITIPNSVTSIGQYAFKGCTNLTSVNIGNGVTSIGQYAFSGCSNLENVTIGNGVTSIGNSAFNNCTSLTSITIPDSVTSIEGHAFEGCSSLENVTIGNGVTSIGNSAFNSCTSLTSITIPDSITSIGESAFWDCSKLTSVTIPDSITSIGVAAFYNCTSLTSITIPDSITSIGNNAFRGCSNLASITCYAPIAPSIQQYTLYNIKRDGTLYVPTGSDYSSWMSTDSYYPGYYNWTIHYI